ncbi:MAG: hypothetical protein B6I32_06390 [Desulfobacterium sp. 4572_20]|nr:MAG: hypothetical protein B6I32_06390 [Desulfobacterium sp. 4572_20]
MNRKKKLKLLLACILLFMSALIGYKIYLLVYEADYYALNADHIDQIESRLRGKDTYSFAVVGNVKNSMRIFERRIAPLIKGNGADFILSAGNAVYDGTEDKYRLLYRGFKKLGIPYVLATGHNEVEDFGSGKFYRHFGPLFFSFHLKNAYFIFLDSTGETSWKWQERWLRQELALAREYPYRFVVLVGPDHVACKNVAVPHRLNPFRERLETLKLFLHSFFYMSLFISLLTLGIISLVALKVYSLIIRQEHFYRDFSIDEEALSKAPLRVAMFTNNYLPFIGGVPLSIDRLYQGLVRMGAAVKVFAPSYSQQWLDPKDGSVFRCPALFHASANNFPVANIFSRKIDAAFKAYSCDIVHVHHPFWLGKKGMRLAKKRGIPVVFTYHTRLERYTHYIPLPGTVLKNLAAHFLIKRFANKCDAIITPTSSTEEYLRNIGVSSLIETIPTGINIGDYERWSSQQVQAFRGQYATTGELLLISVSRMAKEKNLDFLIDGLVKVKNRTHTPFKCLLVGDGPERERLAEKVCELGMGERIIFTGNMAPRDVIQCYLAADLFVFSSTSETQGMALLEAMAGRCPVVAVRASGVYDVVKDGYNGFKVPESTESWAKAVVNLLEDNQQLLDLSENSRAFAENYSVEKITEKVSRLYHRVLVLSKSDAGST